MRSKRCHHPISKALKSKVGKKKVVNEETQFPYPCVILKIILKSSVHRKVAAFLAKTSVLLLLYPWKFKKLLNSDKQVSIEYNRIL